MWTKQLYMSQDLETRSSSVEYCLAMGRMLTLRQSGLQLRKQMLLGD